MKIRTQFIISVILFAAILITLATALFVVNGQIARYNRQNNLIHNVERMAREMGYTANSYLLYGESQLHGRWESTFDELSVNVSNLSDLGPEEEIVVDSLNANLVSLGTIFADVSTAIQRNSQTPGGFFDRSFIQVSWSRLEVQNQAVVFDAARLSGMLDNRLGQASQLSTTLLSVLITVFAIYIFSTYLLLFRRTLSSISELNKGATVIGSGNLDYTVPEKHKDEVGDLSRAFNRMTADLKTVTASKSELEKEIEGRKQAEEELRASEQRWSTTLASIGDAVIATDATGKLTFMNAEAEVLTGWTLKEASGKPVSEVFNIINEQTRRPVESPIPRIIRDGIVVALANHTILLKKDGSEVPIDDSGAPIKDDNGRVNGVVLIFRDVTERRNADKVKDEFIGLVSHELRTPLTIVTGAVHTAMLEGLPPEELPSLLQEAASGAESLASILDNLLELSRYQANRLRLNLESTNTRQVINTVVKHLSNKSPLHTLLMDVPQHLPSVQVDRVRLERILYNLIDNAVKYSPKGGEVRIFAREDGKSLVIGVSDQGIGISPEDQAQLFQPFQRLEQQAQSGIKGLGLGLIVCRRLVEAHKGCIWMESAKGQGTTFYFSFPVPD